MQSLFNAIYWVAAFTVIFILYYSAKNWLRKRKLSDKRARQARRKLQLLKKANVCYVSELVGKMVRGQILWLEISVKASPDKTVLLEKSPGKNILRISLKPVRWNDEQKSTLISKGVIKIEDKSDASMLEIRMDGDHLFYCVDYIFREIYELKNDDRFEYNFCLAE